MEIISHRGYWKNVAEKNQEEAFIRSFQLGIGTETDVRDFNGGLVISHDISSGQCMGIDDFLSLYNKLECEGTLAINIKSDGLQELLIEALNKASIKKYFLFDMSVPDAIVSLNMGLVCFARYSEYEPKSDLWSKCTGIWMDSFHEAKLNTKLLKEILLSGQKACIVSSELHGRNYIELWEELKSFEGTNFSSEGLILCTDIPEIAQRYFNE